LWSERLARPFLAFLGIDWHTWVTDLSYDDAINTGVQVAGWLLFSTGVSLIVFPFVSPFLKQWLVRPLVVMATCVLAILAFCYYLDHFLFVGQLFEYALLVSTPMLLFYSLQKKYNARTLFVAIKIATSLTFICHGLYAMGYYPQPGDWQQIAMNITNTTTAGARQLLSLFGYADFIAVGLIWIPNRLIAQVGWWYLIVWGVLSAGARLIGTYQPDFMATWLTQSLHNTVFRLCHGLVPLVGWWLQNIVSKPHKAA